LGPIAFASSLPSMIVMITAGLVAWWVIFAALVWAIRFYFREPPIPAKQKITVIVVALVVVGCLYGMRPASLEGPRSPLERAMDAGDTNAVERILKSNPALANKLFRFGNETPLFRAAESRNPKANIDLLVERGADINAKSGGFKLTPLQQAAWSGNIEAV